MSNRMTQVVPAIFLACAACAANRTWDGGGTDANWGTAANWDGDVAAPVAGDALIFGGTANLANTNNLDAGTPIAGITFDSSAGAFVLDGNAIALSGDVANNDADIQTINLPLTLDTVRTVNAASGALALGGSVGGVGGISKTGTKSVTLGASNSYEDVTSVLQGNLSVTNPYALGGTEQGTVVSSGATLTMGGGITVAEPVTLINYNPGSLISSSGANTFSGLITISGGQARVRNDAPAPLAIVGGITSITSTVILNTGGIPGADIRVAEKPIIAEGQKMFVHGGQTTTVAVAGNILSRMEVAGGKFRAEVPNAWPANLMLEVGVSYATASYIDLLGNDQTVGQLTGVINITNQGSRVITSTAGPATLTVNQSATTEYNSNFGGEVRLVKIGSGTLAVTGTNCQQTGQTVIGGGKLRILSEDTLGFAPATFTPDHLLLSNNAALLANSTVVLDDATRGITLGEGGGAFEPAAEMTVSNAITGAGTLTKTGTGTLVLAGDNDYAGQTLVSAGVLRVDRKASLYGGSALSASQFAVSSGATLAMRVGGAESFTGEDVAAIAALGTASTGFMPGSWFSLYTESPVSIADVLGNPSGGHGLNLLKLGNDTLELTGLNTYTGITRIAQGVLSVSTLADGGLPSGIGAASNRNSNLVFAGGTLRYTGLSVRCDRAFTYGVTTNYLSFDVAEADTVLTLCNLGGSSMSADKTTGTAVEKTGPGTLVFGNIPAKTGGSANKPLKALYVREGKLSTESGNVIQQNLYGLTADGPCLVFGDGAELSYNTPLERNGDHLVQYVGTQARAQLTSGSFTLCGPDTYPANVHTFDIGDGADVIDMVISAKMDIYPGATAVSDVVKTGAGTLKVTHTQNAWRGRTIIRNGRLLVEANVLHGTAGPLGASTNVIQFGDALSTPSDLAEFMFEGTTDKTCSRAISVTPECTTGVIGCVSNVNVTFSGMITVSNTLALVSVTSGTNALFITGGIAGPGGVTMAGTGTVFLAAANSYTGTTTLASGTLRLAASERIDDASPLRLVDGTLKLNGFSETAGRLDVDGAAVIDFGSGAATLTLDDSAVETWDGTVLLRNWTSGSDHLYIGTSATLSAEQLAKIHSPSGQKAAQLADGEVVLLPLGTLITIQ